MSFKTDLQSNNTDLQAILDTINALPEAGSGGGGGSAEACTVTISGSDYNGGSGIYGGYAVYYVRTDGSYATPNYGLLQITLTDVLKGSFIFVAAFNALYSCDGGISKIADDYGNDYATRWGLFYCNGDGTINPAGGGGGGGEPPPW